MASASWKPRTSGTQHRGGGRLGRGLGRRFGCRLRGRLGGRRRARAAARRHSRRRPAVDLGASRRLGADDQTGGDGRVECLGPVTGCQVGVEQGVDGIGLVEAAHVGHEHRGRGRLGGRRRLGAEGDDVVDVDRGRPRCSTRDRC